MQRVINDWPSFYPSDIPVPPCEALLSDGAYFRLVRVAPPTRECFASTHEEQPNRHKKCHSLETRQNVYGCSIFDNKEQAIGARDKFPEMLGDRIVSLGSFIPDDGKIKQTFRPGHYTVWLRTSAVPHTRFNMISEESE